MRSFSLGSGHGVDIQKKEYKYLNRGSPDRSQNRPLDETDDAVRTPTQGLLIAEWGLILAVNRIKTTFKGRAVHAVPKVDTQDTSALHRAQTLNSERPENEESTRTAGWKRWLVREDKYGVRLEAKRKKCLRLARDPFCPVWVSHRKAPTTSQSCSGGVVEGIK